MNVVMRLLKDEKIKQENSKFEISCYLEISVRKNNSQRIKENMDNIHGLKAKYLRTE